MTVDSTEFKAAKAFTVSVVGFSERETAEWPEDFGVFIIPAGEMETSNTIVKNPDGTWTVIRYRHSLHPCNEWSRCVSVTIRANNWAALRQALCRREPEIVSLSLGDPHRASQDEPIEEHLQNGCTGCNVAHHHFNVRATNQRHPALTSA